MGLIKGYTGFLHHPNLATNGNFRINQRGFTEGVPVPVTIGDYVADCWQIQGGDVDQLRAYLWPNVEGSLKLGALELSGYGKKGQSVVLLNTEKPNAICSRFPGEGADTVGITVTVNAIIPSGQNAVPVYIGVTPPRGEVFSDYDVNAAVIRRGEPQRQLVSSMYTSIDRATQYPGNIGFTLEESGYFNVILSSYAIYPGKLRNPPNFSFVHYAEDLARCQRYFQKGTFRYSGKATQFNTDHATHCFSFSIPTMAGVPSITVTPTVMRSFTGTGGNYDDLLGDIGVSKYISCGALDASSLNPGIYWAAGGTNMYTYGVEYMANWTATV